MKKIIGFFGERSRRAGRANLAARLPLRWLPAIALLALVAQSALAQAGFQTTVPTDILTQFRNQRILWTTNVWVYANRLFGILALIEFTWSAVTMVLDKTDLQSWTSALIRKIMWIGAFYALLINGRNWIPAIIDSFEQIGSNAAAMAGPLSPSDVMAQGINIAGALMDSAGSSGFFTNPGPAFALVFCAILIVLSYVIITINFVVVMVESYIIVSVGFVFLGFGGSRWTAPYVERYIGLAVSIGIKIVLIYCLISAGFNLGIGWAAEAATVGASAHPALTAFDAMGGAVIFMMLCWQIPKLFGAVLGGAPALTGGDLVTTGTALAAGAFAIGSFGAGAVASLAGASAAGTVAGTTSAAKVGAEGAVATRTSAEVNSAASAAGRGGSVPPPGTSSPSANGMSPKTPSPPRGGPGSSGAAVEAASVSPNGSGSSAPPPTSENGSARASTTPQSALADLGGEPLSGSGFERERPGKGFAQQSFNLDSDRPATDARGDSLPSPLEETAQNASSADKEPPSSGSSEVKEGFSSVAKRSNRSLDRAAKRIRNIGRRIALDSAPQVSPPRMPIEHEE
jgi:type IV secretion system protein TrbL